MEILLKLNELVQDNNVLIDECLETIENQEVTKYPIFIFSTSDIELGIELGNPSKHDVPGFLKISSLEEFVSKNIILNDQVEDFIKKYKDNDGSYCFLNVQDKNSNFVFVPKNIKSSQLN